MTEAMLRADEIDGRFRPARRSTIASVHLDGEAVLYDEDTGHSHLLNPTATVVWGCFDGELSLDELVLELADAFGVASDIVRDDIIGLARQFGRQGLLVGVAGDADHADASAHVDRDGDDCIE